MEETKLRQILSEIRPPDEMAASAARKRQEMLAKPPGSLGKLEEIAVRLAAITGQVQNRVDTRRILVFCADNGVVDEGVSCTPREVTAAQAVNMTRRVTGMSCMAKYFHDDVQVIDVGIATAYDCPQVVCRKIAPGTRNLYKEPAMTRAQAVDAVLTGIEMAEQAKSEGVELLGVGEMGIGNTTTSAAVLAALTGASVEAVTGRGGGLLDDAFAKKKEVIGHALKLHQPNPNDPIDVLCKVGGLDLAAMCGAFIGAARCRVPIVIDGFISIVAALCAVRLAPLVQGYLFPSHASYEAGYRLAAQAQALEPWLLLDMRLGEGSGCTIAFRVIEAACAVMNEMETFAGAQINDGYLDEIRKEAHFGA